MVAKSEIKKERRVVEEKASGSIVRKDDLWEKIYHTDARVSAMESQMQDMGGSINRIESMLLNKQTPPLAIIGVMLTALTLLAGLLFGMSQITQASIAPLADDVAEHRIALDKLSSFEADMQYKLGALEEWQSNLRKNGKK